MKTISINKKDFTTILPILLILYGLDIPYLDILLLILYGLDISYQMLIWLFLSEMTFEMLALRHCRNAHIESNNE